MKPLHLLTVMSAVVLLSASGLFAQAGIGLVPLEELNPADSKERAVVPDDDQPEALKPADAADEDAAPTDAEADAGSDGLSAAPLLTKTDEPKVSDAPAVNPYPTIFLAMFLVLAVLVASFKPAKRSHLD